MKTKNCGFLNTKGMVLVLASLALMAGGVISGVDTKWSEITRSSQAALRRPTGSPQLISYEKLPGMDGEMCEWVPASAGATLVASLQQERSSARAAAGDSDEAKRAEIAKRKPVRMIKDSYASYSSIAVDPVNNEVVMTDESLFQILVYDRQANTPPTARMTEPKRILGGLKTKIEFQCGLYIDPQSGDIYAVNNDTVDTLVIFSRQARGDVPPDRELYTPHGTFGIAVDEEAKEMFLTIQHDNAVVVYRKGAQKDEAPVRLLQGDRTLLADPHGIALDTKNNLIFVTNHGSVSSRQSGAQTEGTLGRGGGKANWPSGRNMVVPGSGKHVPPSITVYSKSAQGDTAPLRVIQGPQTRMNWPTGIAADPERGELYVANDMGDEILVFSASAGGDAAPVRVLKGPKTLIQNPTGLYLDLKNDELWVANFGNHTATVYKRAAAGDTAPVRVIRSGPMSAPAPMIGNPHPVAYDTKRDELLVPN